MRISVRDRQPPRESNEYPSRLQHPIDASVHLIFFDELAAGNLIQPYLHLFSEPAIVVDQAVNRLRG